MNIKNRLYIATYAENSIEMIKKYSLGMESNHICITECLDNESTIFNLQDDLKYCGCEDRLIVHGPFTEIIPMGIDQKLVKAGMDRLNQAAEFALKAGSKKMVVHTGLIPQMYYDVWHIEKSSLFWTEFMKDKPKDFELCIENVFENSPKALKEIIDNIDDDRAGICLDVGHAHAVKEQFDAKDWIEYLGNRIKHFHIHNNNGTKDTHSPLGEGTIDYIEIFKAINEHCNDDVTFTIESMNCIDSIKWLTEEEYI